MLRQNYMNKYKEKSLYSRERFLKDDEEYILNESRPIQESSIKNLNDEKMDKFIENILTDKDLASILYSTNAKIEIKSYYKAKKNFGFLRNNKKNKTEKEKNENNMIFKKRFIREAYNQVKSEIDNYKINQINQQNIMKCNNYKKFMEIKKMYETEKDKREKEIENNRIIGIRRAYNKIKEKFEQKRRKKGKNLLLTETKFEGSDSKGLISLPKLNLNIHNVYSRLYKNAVISFPINNKNKKSVNKIKRQLTQDELRPKTKIKFSLKNAVSSNNGKEFTMNVNENIINTCLNKYSGGPGNLMNMKEKIEEKKGETCKENKHINFYDLEEKKTGNSYLHSAIIDNHIELVRYILEKGADVNKQNNDGDTSLHLALKSGNMEMIKVIMNKKPDLDIPNKEGIIPLNLFSPQMKKYFNIENLSFDGIKK